MVTEYVTVCTYVYRYLHRLLISSLDSLRLVELQLHRLRRGLEAVEAPVEGLRPAPAAPAGSNASHTHASEPLPP